MTNRQEKAVEFLKHSPYKIGQAVGFKDLTALHNDWIVDMLCGKADTTLQAHRGSYKTTCVSIALALLIILRPQKTILFLRKTDADTKEVLAQVKKILQSDYIRAFVKIIWGQDIAFVAANQSELTTNLAATVKGAPQLTGLGMGGSLTGKHYDYIFTDDIVNLSDRISKAERDRTKMIYQELQNIKNRGGRIFNTGTPWHKDDCFSIMPQPQRFDCYSTGLIRREELENIKNKMTASLFAANYELRHIADEDLIFTTPQTGFDPALAEQGECHIDAAYGGADFTAFTICRKVSTSEYYVYGRIWHKHIDDCLAEILAVKDRFNAGVIYVENNADKGYLAKDLRAKGQRVAPYHENMNKFVKITSYLKAEWSKVHFVEGTDEEYINQICDYNENAEHDDAPDSLASLIRKKWYSKGDEEKYKPIIYY